MEIKVDDQGHVTVDGLRVPKVAVATSADDGSPDSIAMIVGEIPRRVRSDALNDVLALVAEGIAIGGGMNSWLERKERLPAAQLAAVVGNILAGPADTADARAWCDVERSALLELKRSQSGPIDRILDALLDVVDMHHPDREERRSQTPEQDVARLVERALSPPRFPSLGSGSQMEYQAISRWAAGLRADVARARASYRWQWPEGERHLQAVEATVDAVAGRT